MSDTTVKDIANFKRRNKFVQVFIGVKKDYELSPSQSILFGYLFNHCINLNNNGYCGHSNERIADDVDSKLTTLKSDLKALKVKELILVKNEGSRSRKVGESREIWINPAIFESGESNEDMVDELQTKDAIIKHYESVIANLTKQLEDLNTRPTDVTPTAWSKKLVTCGYISKDEYNEAPREYNDLMDAFIHVVNYDLAYLDRALHYLTSWANKTVVKSKTAYLEKFIKDTVARLDQIAKEDANMTQDFIDRYDF